MEAKSLVVLEVKKEMGVYQFLMPMGAKYGEAYDVAMECGKQIWEMAEKARNEEEAKIAESKKMNEKAPKS